MKWPLNYDALIKRMRNPLHIAVANGNVAVISNLLNQGANVNATEVEGITPLHVAIKKERISVLKLLLKSGADVNAKNHGYTPLHLAVYSRKVKIFKLLLDSDGISTEVKDMYGYTPLHSAAESKNINILKLLLEVGANVRGLDNYGRTPLYNAVSYGTFDHVKLLLEAGADVSTAMKSKFALQNSIIRHYTNKNTLKLLLKNGLSLHARDIRGDTLVTEMIGVLNSFYKRYNSNANLECLQFMLEYTDIKLTNKNGKNMMSHALKSVPGKNKQNDYCHVILEHIAKLKALNVEINSSLLDTIFETSDFNEYFIKCEQELKKAMETKLHNCWVAFFNLLVNNEIKFVKFAGNQDLIQDLEQNVQSFPIYGSKMQRNVSKGIERRKLWESSAIVLSYITCQFSTRII